MAGKPDAAISDNFHLITGNFNEPALLIIRIRHLVKRRQNAVGYLCWAMAHYVEFMEG